MTLNSVYTKIRTPPIFTTSYEHDKPVEIKPAPVLLNMSSSVFAHGVELSLQQV
jgi:hypothetical protein